MIANAIPRVTTLALGILLIAAFRTGLEPVQQQAIPIDADDISGVVTGPAGPEAGVWVIAETNTLPTKFVRIVVTDDRGRYVMPALLRTQRSHRRRGQQCSQCGAEHQDPDTAIRLSQHASAFTASAART